MPMSLAEKLCHRSLPGYWRGQGQQRLDRLLTQVQCPRKCQRHSMATESPISHPLPWQWWQRPWPLKCEGHRWRKLSDCSWRMLRNSVVQLQQCHLVNNNNNSCNSLQHDNRDMSRTPLEVSICTRRLWRVIRNYEISDELVILVEALYVSQSLQWKACSESVWRTNGVVQD